MPHRCVHKCTLCSRFQALILRELLNHYDTVHSNEVNFRVVCGVDCCPATFTLYNSLYKHVVKRHRRTYEDVVIDDDSSSDHHDEERAEDERLDLAENDDDNDDQQSENVESSISDGGGDDDDDDDENLQLHNPVLNRVYLMIHQYSIYKYFPPIFSLDTEVFVQYFHEVKFVDGLQCLWFV